MRVSGILAPSSLVAHGDWFLCHRCGVLKSNAFLFFASIHILCMKKLIISGAFNLLLGSLVMLTFCYATFRSHKAIFVLAYKWHFRASEECLKACTASYPLISAEVQILWTVSLCVCPRGTERDISSSWSLQITTLVAEMSLCEVRAQTPSVRWRTQLCIVVIIRQDACEGIEVDTYFTIKANTTWEHSKFLRHAHYESMCILIRLTLPYQ